VNSRDKIIFSAEKVSAVRNSLLNELRTAASGVKASLAFARHNIPGKETTLEKTRVIVVGGTNLVSAVAAKDIGGVITFHDRAEEKLPVFADAKTLYRVIEKYIDHETGHAALNFAYPLAPFTRDERLDGILIRGTKEHTFNDLIAKPVGGTLEKMLFKTKGAAVKISTANDTVCLVLAGSPLYPPNTLAGGVIGTGFNFGFFLNEHELVNLESGNFSNFIPSDTCRRIDSGSVNPGGQLYEKEVSGAYLHLHYNYFLESLSCKFKPLSKGSEVSAAAQTGDETAAALLEKSASLAAAEIAAIWEFKEKQKLNLIIEGSLYWKGFGYGGFVNQYLEQLNVPSASVNITGIEESSLAGAAAMIL
jgi:hexokinase